MHVKTKKKYILLKIKHVLKDVKNMKYLIKEKEFV